MAINVTHSKVSTIPDGDDTSVVRPSDWNDDHVINGLGTMAEQDADAVAITGGTISGVTLPASNITGTLDVPHGGTGATTLTGYVKGTGTSALTASSTIPNTDITGLGTASTKDAGVALGVATLDAGGTVPLSQIPASIIGGLNYQGTWNASTNTPTLTSSVGTKGYYYAVSVSGTTNLNGITDWTVGDLAVFDGSAWQQIDNTDAVTSVNGYTGTVVLGYADVGAFPATATTGTGSVVLQTSPTINTPTLSGATIDGTAPYLNYTPTTAPTYVEGRVFYDSTAHTLNYYNDNSEMSVNIGQEQIIRVRNQTGSTIPDGSVVYVNGATGNTPTISLAIATSFSTADIIGVTTTNIANNGFGYVTINGLVNGLDTSAFADGDAVFLSATTAGAFTATEPNAPNYAVQVGVIVRANPTVGTLLVATQQISVEVSHIIGTLAVSQGGTGQTSYTNGQLLIGNTTGNTLTKATLTAGTGVSVTNGAGSITLANTGVTSAVAGTGISVSGSTGAVTVTNTAPDQTVSLTAGTGISTSGTYPNFTITNTAPSSGGTVTSVTGTAPVVSSGGNTPAISMAAATGSVNGYLTSTDWTTFNGKAPAVTYTSNYVPYGQGTTTPALSSNFQFNGTTLTVANDAVISGLDIGKGGGSVSTNTRVGAGALSSNTSGLSNVAMGYLAFNANTTGQGGVAIGSGALQNNTTGVNNSGIGINSLLTNTTGQYNSAFGTAALQSNTTASNNTAVGYFAAIANTTGVGISAFGSSALASNTTGYGNCAFGQSALTSNTTGINNIAIGGTNAVDSGPALNGNTTGSHNVAVGNAALVNNTTGSNNVAIGKQALSSNGTASNNTAVGYQALLSNTTSEKITAVGSGSLQQTTGTENTAIGHNAGNSTSSGTSNVYVGHQSGNWAVNHTTGTDSVFIGNKTSPAAGSDSSTIVIGSGTTGKGSSTGFINAGSGVYQGNNSTLWSIASDARLKKNIVDNNTGLDLINSIKVRNFEYRLPEEITEVSQEQAIQKTGIQLGAIAQELQVVLPECVKQQSTGIYTVDADPLIWYLINAVKELNAKVTALENKQ